MSSQPPENINVLVVEDNQADADYACQLLDCYAERPFVCVCVGSLSDARQRLEQGDIHVILLDLELPDACGSQGLLSLHAHVPDVPIVVLTGLDDEHMAAQSVAAGAQDYLSKSAVDRKLLVRTVSYALERQKAEAGIQKSERRFRTVFEHAPVGMVLAELTADIKILEVNQAFGKLLGFAQEELVGRSLLEFVHAHDWPGCWEAAECDLRQGTGNLVRQEIRLLSRSRQTVFGQINLSLITDEKQGPLRLLAMVEDISDTRELIASRQRADFMSTLAHDMKTPLVGASMVLGALLEGTVGALDPSQSELIAKLRASNQALLKKIHNLLEIYALESGKKPLMKGDVDIASLLEAAVDRVQTLAELKNIEIRKSVKSPGGSFSADGDAVRCVLENLLDNAIKFSHEGTTVEITAEKSDSLVLLSVKDSGQGMTESIRQRLFQRFFQGDPAKSYSASCGLGLYLCNRIVEASGGKITCSSQLGQGTTFTLELPL